MHQSNKRLRILHIAETLKGGIETYLCELILCQQARYGVDSIFLYCPAEIPKSLSDLLPASNILASKPSNRRLLRAALIARRVHTDIEKLEIDIAHLHSTFAGLAARLVLSIKSHRPQVVYCPHGWCFDQSNSSHLARFLYTKTELFLARITDLIICISQHELTLGVQNGLPKDIMKVCLNALADRHPQRIDQPIWPPTQLRILFIGRFDYQKGIDVFFETMRLLGEDYYAFAIGERVRSDLPLPPPPSNIGFTGWLGQTDVQAYIGSCDVLVVPSRWEGFGLVALEAMRAAKPVVASNAGGLPEIVVDGKTGFLVANDPLSISAAISTTSSSMFKLMGEQGRTRFLDKFLIANLEASIATHYEGLFLGKRQSMDGVCPDKE